MDIARFIRFVLVGIGGFAVDTTLTMTLLAAGLSPVVARVPGLSASILITWFLNRRFAFRARHSPAARSLYRFAGVAAVSAGANFGLYAALVAAGMPPLASIVLATACSMSLSFVGYGRFAFAPASR
ncbi:MAG: GtrA family protein [Burkholderiales bacterium]|nr:MAG: GtrA family protein [Burkholderiales bacterium]